MRYRDKKSGANILVVNCGSSSLKYKIMRMPQECELVSGEAERVGIKTSEQSLIRHCVGGRERVRVVSLPDHTAAFREAIGLLREDRASDPGIYFDAFAHRYVHPGEYFSVTTRIGSPALKKLRETIPLAPLHNPISYALIELCHNDFPSLPQFAVFDTAFHAGIPKKFSSYALPSRLAKQYGLRRVGFHGISHQFVWQQACKVLGRDNRYQRVISCHLGTGGSSVCAIENGKSINRSMGFTPLEGLVMNTRCGDMDLGLFFYIMFQRKFDAKEAETILNKKSGILGIFSDSSDLRDALKSFKKSSRARMAFAMYVARVRKYIGFYSLLLKKADILIFTDSLGTGVPALREEICRNLRCLGIALDTGANDRYAGGVADISDKNSETRVMIVPTNEELMIAREAYGAYCHGRGG